MKSKLIAAMLGLTLIFTSVPTTIAFAEIFEPIFDDEELDDSEKSNDSSDSSSSDDSDSDDGSEIRWEGEESEDDSDSGSSDESGKDDDSEDSDSWDVSIDGEEGSSGSSSDDSNSSSDGSTDANGDGEDSSDSKKKDDSDDGEITYKTAPKPKSKPVINSFKVKADGTYEATFTRNADLVQWEIFDTEDTSKVLRNNYNCSADKISGKNLQDGIMYKLKVAGKNNTIDGKKKYVNVSEATGPVYAYAISQPIAKSCTKDTSKNTITLNWSKIKGCKYKVYISNSTSNYKALKSVASGTTTLKVTKDANGNKLNLSKKKYYFQIEAIREKDTSVKSPKLTIKWGSIKK